MIRTTEEVVDQIKNLIETNVKPAVAGHGGIIEFLSYKDGNLVVELGGACSGCSSSIETLKMGVENMIKHFVPEVLTVSSEDGISDVAPYYTDHYDDFNMNDYGRDGLDHE